MLKTILIIIGGVVALAIAYVGWVISQAMRNADESVSTEFKASKSSLSVQATLTGSDATYTITEIRFPRKWGRALGIKPPDGYSEKPYTVQDTDDASNPESLAWVQEANTENFRWLGAAQLAPDVTTSLEFPIEVLVPGQGAIRFQYERKIGVSGNLAFFSAEVRVNET